VVSSHNVSILHRFRNIATKTLYVTAYVLQKSFSFDTTVVEDVARKYHVTAILSNIHCVSKKFPPFNYP